MENIKACIRIKPVQESVLEEVVYRKFEENSIANLKTKEKFDFEYVFDEEYNTQGIFEKIAIPLIDAFFAGINVCIFAYGQTSSGKTFTMKGNTKVPGLIPQALSEIFQRVSTNNESDFEIRCSYIEIYNENVNDLLNPENKNLEIRENISKGIHIPGLTDALVSGHKEAYQLFEMGESFRKFGETSLNEQSSRSHTVFRIAIEIRNKSRPDKITSSTLNLIDLAGSEGVSRSKTEGLRKKEGANINKSLLSLSSVIFKLASKEPTYVNFRDSKLTRLLQPCLAGNSRTVVICTINPVISNYQETMNTLKFALSAGAIKNQVKINEKIIGEKASIFKEQSKEYSELKSEVIKNKEIYETILASQSAKIDDYEQKISGLIEENIKLKNTNNSLYGQVDHYAKKVSSQERELSKIKSDNKALVDLLGEVEFKTKKLIDDKTNDFHSAYAALDRKLREFEQENNHLKAENKRLLIERKVEDQSNKISNEESKKITEFYKEQINQMMNTIEVLTAEVKKKSSTEKTQEGVQINTFNMQNFINMTPPALNPVITNLSTSAQKKSASIKVARPRKLSEDGYEMKLLELEASLKSQLFQKNREVAEMNQRIRELQTEISKRDDKIFRLEDELIAFKSRYANKSDKENQDVNIYEDIGKKQKMGHFEYIRKKVSNSPTKEELKKEIKYLQNKNKNYEKRLERNKMLEEKYYKKIDDLSKHNLDLENMLNANLSVFN